MRCEPFLFSAVKPLSLTFLGWKTDIILVIFTLGMMMRILFFFTSIYCHWRNENIYSKFCDTLICSCHLTSNINRSLNVSCVTFCQHYQVEVSRILNMLAFTYKRKGKSDPSISCTVETSEYCFSWIVTDSPTKFCSRRVFSPDP